MDQREDFNRLLSDCRKGRIDKVLVKSISRFSRNAKDCLAALRELTALGVSVCFEKENLNTETLTTELMVSVSSALAQQESISIAENQRISYQRRMERGEFITCKAPFARRATKSGYISWSCRKHDDRAADCSVGRIAETELYLDGLSYQKISDILNSDRIPFSGETPLWNKHKVKRLLEKSLFRKVLLGYNFGGFHKSTLK